MIKKFLVSLFDQPSLLADPNDLIPGVTKPSWALAGMVAAHVLKNLGDVVCPYPLLKTRTADCSYARTARFHDAKMSIDVAVNYARVYGKSPAVFKESSITCNVHFGPRSSRPDYYPFDAKEKALICEAFRKASILVEERRNSKRLTDQQQKACDIINNLFGPPIIEEQPSAATA